jgi:D-sedoheptulose 7-phosphate isomerase
VSAALQPIYVSEGIRHSSPSGSVQLENFLLATRKLATRYLLASHDLRSLPRRVRPHPAGPGRRSVPPSTRPAASSLDTLRHDKKLLICGNGGSAAEAGHFSTELVGRYQKNRAPLPAIALSADGSLLTCIGNDYGYDQVFSRQIAGLARPGDLVVVLTSSGNSANIIAALATRRDGAGAEEHRLPRPRRRQGPRASPPCDLIIPSHSGAACQEAHLFLIHHFCELIDAEFA